MVFTTTLSPRQQPTLWLGSEDIFSGLELFSSFILMVTNNGDVVCIQTVSHFVVVVVVEVDEMKLMLSVHFSKCQL